jgi:hypothetical protein
MSDNIYSLNEFRKPQVKDQHGNPIIVTFYWAPFFDETKTLQCHAFPVKVTDGDYQGLVDAVKAQDGIYHQGLDGKKAWIFPWPPAAISLHVIDAETGEMIPLT